EEADKLLSNIDKDRFSAETLAGLTKVLDHECLCLETINCNQDQYPQKARALWIPWTAKLVEKLSDWLNTSIWPEVHFQRELQLRALLSALALQLAHNTAALKSNNYVTLQRK